MTPEPDLVILGAGSGGYACALRAADLGLRPVLVEEGPVGGTCLHRGCIPTKAVLHAAEVADTTRGAAALGVHASLDRVDLKQVRSYADRVVSRLHRGLTGLINSRDIEVVPGRGTVLPGGEPAVRVGDRTITAPHLVLATGSVPRTLPGIDIDGSRVLTSDHALQLTELPGSAIVLGGGVIGVEFASAWRSFGVDVTVVEALDRLLPAEEPEISTALQRAFAKRKIGTQTGTAVRAVDVADDSVTVTFDSGQTRTADVLLVAVGRGPNTDGTGIADAGVALDHGWVSTDERLRTSTDGIYAVGDLVPGPQLAHRGFAHGIFVAEDIAARREPGRQPPTPVADAGVPRITYSDPEVASVGLSEEAARERYGAVEAVSYDLGGNGRSQILQTRGMVRVVRRKDGPVVGVSMVGARVGELIGEAQLITNWQAHPDEVAELIHAHPTQGEALGEAHLALAGKPLHGHGG